MSAHDLPLPPADRLTAAVIAASTGALDEAERELEALVHEPTVRDWALYDLAMLHLRTNDLDRAADELRQAVESNDRVIGPGAAFHLAHIEHLKGNSQAELRWLESVTPDSGVAGSASLNRASLEFERGDVSAAADAAWAALIRADALTERLFALAMLARIYAQSDPQFAARCLRAVGPSLFSMSEIEPDARGQLIDMARSIRYEIQESIHEHSAAAAASAPDHALYAGVSFRDQIHAFLGGSRHRPLSHSDRTQQLIAVLKQRRIHRMRYGFEIVLRHRTDSGLSRDIRLVEGSRGAMVLLFEAIDSRRVRYLGDFVMESFETDGFDLHLVLRVIAPVSPRAQR